VQAKDFSVYGDLLIAGHITSGFYKSEASIFISTIDQSFPFNIAFLIKLVFNNK